jgi:hypothetical protein
MALSKSTTFTIDMLHPRANFDFAMDDVAKLLKLHDAETARRPGRPGRQVEVFKRAAIILGITAWESFIEDTIRACATTTLEFAAAPEEVRSWFNSTAERWLRESPKPPAMSAWTGNGWKIFLKRRLEDDLRKLNSPCCKNISELSKRYLNIDLPKKWIWRRTTAETAGQRLDHLINLRGELVHRGPQFFKSTPLRRHEVEQAISLLNNLVACTRGALRPLFSD